MGNSYTFKVLARNSYGSSLYSSEVTILAGQVPSQPVAPTTTISSSNVIIAWSVASTGGSAITAYRITIGQSDGSTFTTSPIYCDGSSASVVTAASCSVPISTLRQAPFSLPWGASVYAKVSASNIYGFSVVSTSGNGAIILTNPDPPTSLIENLADRGATTLGLTWATSATNGGATVLDYTVSYD